MIFEGNDRERLTLLESRFVAFEQDLKAALTAIERIGISQTAIDLRLSQVGRWDMKAILTMAAMAIVPLAGLWALAIAPTQQVQLDLVAEIARTNLRVEQNSLVNERQGVMFAEVETQFRQVTEHRNAQAEQTEGRVAELWEAVFKRPMSRTTQYPVTGNGKK